MLFTLSLYTTAKKFSTNKKNVGKLKYIIKQWEKDSKNKGYSSLLY